MRGMFIEAKSTLDVKSAVEKSLRLLPKKVGIVTTAQHKHKLKEIKKILTENGITAVVGGQVLGCNAGNAKKIANKIDAY